MAGVVELVVDVVLRVVEVGTAANKRAIELQDNRAIEVASNLPVLALLMPMSMAWRRRRRMGHILFEELGLLTY